MSHEGTPKQTEEAVFFVTHLSFAITQVKGQPFAMAHVRAERPVCYSLSSAGNVATAGLQ